MCIIVKTFCFSTYQTRQNACGMSLKETGLIVQGKDFTCGTFPWIVALMYIEKKPPEYFCGGTLISENFVISGKKTL